MTKTRNTINVCLALVVFILPYGVLAKEARGWHWYNEIIVAKGGKNGKNEKNEKNEKDKKTEAKSDELKIPKNLTSIGEMADLRQVVEEAKAKAILYPTEQNVHDYIALQNYVVSKAAKFSSVWQKTLLDYPVLDYAVLHPTENNAQHVVYEKEQQLENQAIASFRDKFGMFFFYRGNNLLDQELAPVIEAFANVNRLSLIPISVDGKTLEVLPNSKNDSGQAAKLGIVYFPALVLVNPITKVVKPLNYGFIAQDELKRRFLQVATDFNEGT